MGMSIEVIVAVVSKLTYFTNLQMVSNLVI